MINPEKDAVHIIEFGRDPIPLIFNATFLTLDDNGNIIKTQPVMVVSTRANSSTGMEKKQNDQL